MIKFSSIQNVVNATFKTIQRFPLETLSTLIGTVCAIILLEKEFDGPAEIFIKTIMSCSLCLVLFLSTSLFFEASNKSKTVRFITSFALGGLLTAYVFSFKEDITNVEFQQYFVLNITFHLLVSFSGFIPVQYKQEDFWEFNKRLFLRILTSGLYSGFIYSGLALAILAVQELFNVNFDEKIYGYLFFTTAGIFNTIFFLNGVPETNNPKKPLTLLYPDGLKRFTQFVLIPLISIYLVILISYETKILVTFSLPVGWISYLVLVFAIFGILSFLLIHPIATKTENLWMRTFSRWFYYLLIPLIGLLFWAILYRIKLYGFTHERYYVLLLSFWLTIVIIYFLIHKQPKIKFIPISLCVLGLLSIKGPQSADTISKNSQLFRFKSYMINFKNNKLNFEQEKDLSSIVDFLEKNYGISVLLPSTNGQLNTLAKKYKNPNSSQIMESLGYVYRSEYERNTNSNFYYNFYNDNNPIENIHGYDISFSLSNYNNLEPKKTIRINSKTYKVSSNKKEYGVDLHINQDKIPLRIYDFINQNKGFKSNKSDKKIIQKIEDTKYALQLTYISVSGKMDENKKIIDEFQINVLLGIKD